MGLGFRIISGKKIIWFEEGEYIYLIKINKLDLKIKKNADVENCGEFKGFESLSRGRGGPMLVWVWVSELYRGRVFSLKGCIYI